MTNENNSVETENTDVNVSATETEVVEQTTDTQQAPKMTESLVRTLNLTISKQAIQAATEKELFKISKNIRLDGFRPGKVPMSRVRQMYSGQASWDALNNKLSEVFVEQITKDDVRVAGMPHIEPDEANDKDDLLAFTATFETYPELPKADLSKIEVEKASATVTEKEINQTIDVLRKQRVSYEPADKAAENNDQVVMDFLGKIDDVPFEGGSATDFNFVLGQGRMLPEFEAAALGMSAGEEKTFDLPFPEDYHGKDVAGKTAQFTITCKAVNAEKLPELDADFASSLGVPDGDIALMKADITENLEREVNARVKGLTKTNVMDQLLKAYEFDVPLALVSDDIKQLKEDAINDLRQRNIPVDDNFKLPDEIFAERATRRVRLGLIIGNLIRDNEIKVLPEQIEGHIANMSKSYEDPEGFSKWFHSDKNRVAEVHSVCLEDNVVDWVLSQTKVTEKTIGFEELMKPEQNA